MGVAEEGAKSGEEPKKREAKHGESQKERRGGVREWNRKQGGAGHLGRRGRPGADGGGFGGQAFIPRVRPSV